MMIEFAAILDGYVGRDLEVSQRILASSKGRRTQQFIARRNGAEIGFVSFDELPEMNCLALCELFVVTRFRGRGLGKLLLEAVEARARAEGYEWVTLSPWPLVGFPVDRLATWYRKQGYSERTGCPTEFEKRIEGPL
ncbi:GNAT family N-acetyltransferase [Bradyrhizobium manausense]|uniref:GNAT family N-acetyltransferase n=1 Tax=Bradyrhizobium manausense TaxID=989370 RepID=UPI001BA6BDD8|nr:GNAT family N-acetyltransferase [Bradyrhizobium manausense]MBR0726790.1 GNAT family N-acetyltransferase [Bradyrhizobium manausense]